MKVLEGLLYTRDHEWIKRVGAKVFIGITDYAQKAMGAIVYVELPEVDSEFEAGDAFAVVESVKAASDVYMPVDGRVLEVNEEIVDNPALVNESPYENWMVSVELSQDSQLENLMDAEEYNNFCEKEK